ncbi:hypothetical protein V1507DRAFT_467764 [Lipomyces tetrasporus]
MDPPMRPRRKQAVDYLLLNDGYEGDVPMENIVPGTAQSSIESSVDLGQETIGICLFRRRVCH